MHLNPYFNGSHLVRQLMTDATNASLIWTPQLSNFASYYALLLATERRHYAYTGKFIVTGVIAWPPSTAAPTGLGNAAYSQVLLSMVAAKTKAAAAAAAAAEESTATTVAVRPRDAGAGEMADARKGDGGDIVVLRELSGREAGATEHDGGAGDAAAGTGTAQADAVPTETLAAEGETATKTTTTSSDCSRVCWTPPSWLPQVKAATQGTTTAAATVSATATPAGVRKGGATGARPALASWPLMVVLMAREGLAWLW